MESTYSRPTQDRKFNYRMSDNLKCTWYSRNSKGSGIGQGMVIYHPLHYLLKQIICISISTIQVLNHQYSFLKSPFISFPLLIRLGAWIWLQSQNLCHQKKKVSNLFFCLTSQFSLLPAVLLMNSRQLLETVCMRRESSHFQVILLLLI